MIYASPKRKCPDFDSKQHYFSMSLTSINYPKDRSMEKQLAFWEADFRAINGAYAHAFALCCESEAGSPGRTEGASPNPTPPHLQLRRCRNLCCSPSQDSCNALRGTPTFLKAAIRPWNALNLQAVTSALCSLQEHPYTKKPCLGGWWRHEAAQGGALDSIGFLILSTPSFRFFCIGGSSNSL